MIKTRGNFVEFIKSLLINGKFMDKISVGISYDEFLILTKGNFFINQEDSTGKIVTYNKAQFFFSDHLDFFTIQTADFKRESFSFEGAKVLIQDISLMIFIGWIKKMNQNIEWKFDQRHCFLMQLGIIINANVVCIFDFTYNNCGKLSKVIVT